MQSLSAPRCRHIKVNGTQCGSPALRGKNFCFHHNQQRPLKVECYSDSKWATGEITLPIIEDAHSIQFVIRQVIQMVLQKRIERKTASLLLYALQIASSNLKRIDLEKPAPEQIVTDLASDSDTPMAALQDEAKADTQEAQDHEIKRAEVKIGEVKIGEVMIEAAKVEEARIQEVNAPLELPPGTIQACASFYGTENEPDQAAAETQEIARIRLSWRTTLAHKKRAQEWGTRSLLAQ